MQKNYSAKSTDLKTGASREPYQSDPFQDRRFGEGEAGASHGAGIHGAGKPLKGSGLPRVGETSGDRGCGTGTTPDSKNSKKNCVDAQRQEIQKKMPSLIFKAVTHVVMLFKKNQKNQFKFQFKNSKK